MPFCESKATAEELWQYCLLEYQSQNPVIKYLFNHFFRTINQIIIQLGPEDRILEVGCGAGESSRRIMQMLSDQHFEVSEYDRRYVEMLKKTGFPARVSQESIYQLKREANQFDCIILLEVLEHLENYRAALKELFRVSKKHVILSVPNESLWRILNIARGKYIRDFGNTPGHINHWSPRRFAKLIEEFGICRRLYRPVPWIVVHAVVR
jgi:2-polyprenyl-3-methyl-5-hydroxy-6-metoxy-1,4-benzoquinol methylase